MRRDEFVLAHRLRVRWAEVDRQDVVFNGNYFLYFDIAITEYWRLIGYAYPEDLPHRFGTEIYAVKAAAEFHGSACYDDVLEVCCRATRIGRSSLQFALGIYRGEERLTSGEITYVNADPKTRKALPWPEAVRRSVLGFERVPPQVAESRTR